MTIQNIIQHLESVAPLAYQASYDNAGVLVGDVQEKVEGVLICLDITIEILEEAKQKKCNMIIAHHPILFQPIKSITGKTLEEKIVISAIKQGIVLYAMHTNLDHISQGVNDMMAKQLGLKNLSILLPHTHILSKITAFVPSTHTDLLLQQLYQAGAGNLGKYTGCSFTTQGLGVFTPKKEAQPYTVISQGQTRVLEDRIELFFPTYLQNKIVETLHIYHPYEEVAYEVYPISNESKTVGSGMIGYLEIPYTVSDFLQLLKEKFYVPCVRYQKSCKEKIQKVALCGGSGSFLIEKAVAKKVDAFVTADIKYHDFFKTKAILIADIGHYESEVGSIDIIKKILSEKFSNIVVEISTHNTNPIHYFI